MPPNQNIIKMETKDALLSGMRKILWKGEEGKYCNHNLAPVEYPTSGSLQLCQNGYNNTLFLLIKKSFYFGLRVLNDRLLNLRLIYDNLRSPQQTPLADHFPKIAVQLLIIAVPTKQVRLRTPSCLKLFQLSSIFYENSR